MELDGADDFVDDDDDSDDLLLPLLLPPLLLEPKFLPEAEDRLVNGEGRERLLRPLVGEAAGRVCDPPPFPPLDKLGIPPPPTPRVPLKLLLPEELTIAVCFLSVLVHLAQYQTRRGSLTSWSVTGGLWHS